MWRGQTSAFVLTVGLVGSLSGEAMAHAPACFPDRTIVGWATLYDSNGDSVGTALRGQVVYVVDESEDQELVEVELHLLGGLRVRVERALLAVFTRTEIPVYDSPNTQGWWAQNAPLLAGAGDAKSALVEPHPRARTPEMGGLEFSPRKLPCAALSGVPLAPLRNLGCGGCSTDTVPVVSPGREVWWWRDQPHDDDQYFGAVSETGKVLMSGHLIEPSDVVETSWGPLRRRDAIARSRLLFAPPKEEAHHLGHGEFCDGHYDFDDAQLAGADVAGIADPVPFRFFEKGKSVLALPTGTKVHVAFSQQVNEREGRAWPSDRIGFHWPSEESPLLSLIGWIPSGHLTGRKRVSSDDTTEATIIDAHEGEVVRLRQRQSARLDALTVVYEIAGERKTAEGVYQALAVISVRAGRHAARRNARIGEPWTWNGYVVQVVGVDGAHARVRLRHVH